jgi:hypothetical protein
MDIQRDPTRNFLETGWLKSCSLKGQPQLALGSTEMQVYAGNDGPEAPMTAQDASFGPYPEIGGGSEHSTNA